MSGSLRFPSPSYKVGAALFRFQDGWVPPTFTYDHSLFSLGSVRAIFHSPPRLAIRLFRPSNRLTGEAVQFRYSITTSGTYSFFFHLFVGNQGFPLEGRGKFHTSLSAGPFSFLRNCSASLSPAAPACSHAHTFFFLPGKHEPFFPLCGSQGISDP